jgi:protoheme ferro-lyase
MVRTSRCFARLLAQFGGPHTPITVQRYLCALHVTGFSFSRFTRCSAISARAQKMERFYEVIVGDPPIRRFTNQSARELRVRFFGQGLIFQAVFESEARPAA